MRHAKFLCLPLAAAMMVTLATPVDAQLGGVVGHNLPVDLPATVERVRDAVGEIADPLAAPVGRVARDARSLAKQRVRRLERLVGDHGDRMEWDDFHQPAVRGEVLLLDPDAPAIETARRQGYALMEQGAIEGLGVRYARLATPQGVPLGRAITDLRTALPGREISADQLHFPSGAEAGADRKGNGRMPGAALPRGGTVGIIDGGIAGTERVIAQRGFAAGAPRASDHASAIASLLRGAGTARIFGADVYGDDAGGGNALAISRALGWMQGQGVPVVSISLVGPANPLLARAVSSAQSRGMVIVAAVGNDGPAAPPAYPASYPGVVAVTGVDGAGRVLIEMGKALHLDYAAPGADMSALVPGKGRVSLRGTSYAAPLVASRIAARRMDAGTAAMALKNVEPELLKGRRGTGRGVLCNICRSGL